MRYTKQWLEGVIVMIPKSEILHASKQNDGEVAVTSSMDGKMDEG